MGAGVLGLPYSFSYLGFVGGSVMLALAGGSALYTAWLLASMHEMNGTRYNRYRDLGTAVLGKKFSNLFIAPFQFTVMVRPLRCYHTSPVENSSAVSPDTSLALNIEEVGRNCWVSRYRVNHYISSI